MISYFNLYLYSFNHHIIMLLKIKNLESLQKFQGLRGNDNGKVLTS